MGITGSHSAKRKGDNGKSSPSSANASASAPKLGKNGSGGNNTKLQRISTR